MPGVRIVSSGLKPGQPAITQNQGTAVLGVIPGGSRIVGLVLSAAARGASADFCGDVSIVITDGVTTQILIDLIVNGAPTPGFGTPVTITQTYSPGLELANLMPQVPWKLNLVAVDDTNPGLYTFSGSVTYLLP